MIARSRAAIHELGMGFQRVLIERLSAMWRFSPDAQAAEATTRAAAERSAQIPDTWFYALRSIHLARAVCDQDRPRSAFRFSTKANAVLRRAISR